MKNEQVFARVEQKYGLSEEQAAAFLELAGPYLKPDARPEYTLRNIYLDSPDDRMIIRSLENLSIRKNSGCGRTGNRVRKARCSWK